jgi:hypothetical protein
MHESIANLYHEVLNEVPLLKLKHSLLKILMLHDRIQGKIHPLGFYSFLLGNVDERSILRLHIWYNGEMQDERLLIHNHVFNFTSQVLVGSLTNQVFAIRPETASIGTLYNVEYTEEGSELKKMKSGFKLIPVESKKVLTGQSYQVLFSDFHQTTDFEKPLTATIVAAKVVSTEKAIVFARQDMGEVLKFKRIEIDEEKCQNVIRLLIERLKN